MAKTISTILNLKDNFSKTIGKTKQGTKEFERQVKQTQNSVKQFKSNIASSFKSAATSALGFASAYMGIRAVTGYLKEAVNMAAKSEAGVAQLGAVLKSTNGAVGMSKKQLLDLAGSYGTYTTYTKGAVLSGENLLLTFTKIGKDVFPDVTTTMLDMSTALKQDTTQSAMQLGKALNDPVRGVTALRRVGVSFTASQIKQIATLQKSGKIVDAQRLILKELQTEFGGSAKAAGQTLPAQMTILKNQFAGIKKSIGEKFIPVLFTFYKFAVSKMPQIKSIFGTAIDSIGKITSMGVNVLQKQVLPVFDEIYKIASPIFLKLQNSVKSAFPAIKSIIVSAFSEVKNTITNAKQPVLNFVNAVASFATLIWSTIQPAVQYIVKNIVPKVWDKVKNAIQGILSAATKTFNFITTNWSIIKPLVEGVAIAWGVYKLAMLRTVVVTKAAALAQLALGLAMKLTPMGMIITGIGLVIGAGILLYKNWDIVKAKAFGLWQGFKSAFAPLAGFFSGMWSGIKAGFKGFINFLISGINLYTGTLSWIPNKLSQIPGFGWAKNFVIPKIPKFALGTPYFKGGLAQINEHNNGEIVDLPSGSKVIPHDKSEKMLSGKNITVNVTIQGNVIGNKQFIDEVGTVISNRLDLALANM